MTTEHPMEVDTRSDEAVYVAHAHELVRFATGLVGPADAPDVVADAFLRVTAAPVWACAHNRRALLFRAVVNEARSRQRSDLRRRSRERRASGPERVESPEFQPEVLAAVHALSSQQRAVVFLTYWNDLTPGAVAELLDVSEGSVRKQLARARKHLRRALA